LFNNRKRNTREVFKNYKIIFFIKYDAITLEKDYDITIIVEIINGQLNYSYKVAIRTKKIF